MISESSQRSPNLAPSVDLHAKDSYSGSFHAMTMATKTQTNTETIQAIYSACKDNISGLQEAGIQKAMRARKTYTLYQFGGSQASNISLPKALRMVQNSYWPSDEWVIVDDATNKIVVEKKAQLALIGTEFLGKGNMEGHGFEEASA